jgi:hypothetical protein
MLDLSLPQHTFHPHCFLLNSIDQFCVVAMVLIYIHKFSDSIIRQVTHYIGGGSVRFASVSQERILERQDQINLIVNPRQK